MTREQEKLYKKLVLLNKSAHSAGEPYLMYPEKELKKYCEFVPDDKAKEFLTAYRSGELQAEQKAVDGVADDSDTVAATPFEMFLWQLYMRCGGNITSGSGESWVLFYSIMRELIEQESSFYPILQSRMTNAFSKLAKNSFLRDPTGNREAVIGKGEKAIKFVIPEETDEGIKIKDISTTTQMLLLWLQYQYGLYRSLELNIPARVYASDRKRSMGRDSIKELIKEIKKDLMFLDNMKIMEIYEKVDGKWAPCGAPLRICGGTAVCTQGIIHWTFNPSFIHTLNKIAPTDYPKEIFSQNPKTSGFQILKYIADNHRMNGNRDIPVKTFLEIAPTIPKIEEVKQKRMSATQKIIKPFFNTLDNINSLYYKFISAEGKEISVEDVTKYDVFEGGKIRIDYDDYPRHDERIKAKEKRKKKIAEAKEKAMRKALEKKAEQEIGLQ